MRRNVLLLMFAALTCAPAPASGQAVDTVGVLVDGHVIRLLVSGTAGPVVVMEAGGGSTHRTWATVVPELSTFARVVTYDRPGYGLSAPCEKPRTAERIAEELRTALAAARIEPPYVLVGWSYGGALARVFAGMYPNAVNGLVLVDPVPEDFYARAAGVVPDRYTVEEETYLNELYTDSTRLAEQREGAAYPSSMEQARASDQKHRTPTTLLIAAGGESRSQADPLWRLWVNELRSWADRRPSVHTVVVEDSGHHISREKPQVVIQAIRDMADTARRIPVR